MSQTRDERIAEIARATERARAVLKPGDRITFTSCPGTKRWGIFEGFDSGRLTSQASWIRTRTRNDISPITISKVNGKPASFRDQDQIEVPHGT